LATSRKKPEPEPEPEDTEALAHALAAAMETWRVTTHVARVAREAETEARRELVELLHRAGLHGFVL